MLRLLNKLCTKANPIYQIYFTNLESIIFKQQMPMYFSDGMQPIVSWELETVTRNQK